MNIISLFSGCGGLDLGFQQAGFNIIWSNEFDKAIYPTHKLNFPDVELSTKDIRDIKDNEIPSRDVDGVIGGPPCQSWSEAGNGLGIKDRRGQLFYEYIRVIKVVRPKFFVAENVPGILHEKHKRALDNILQELGRLGYNVFYQLVDACNFEVPQNRLRVIFVGYRKDITNDVFILKSSYSKNLTLKDAIFDLQDSAVPALAHNKTNPESINNNEYMIGSFSSIYMSRNRVRSWNEQSFTI